LEKLCYQVTITKLDVSKKISTSIALLRNKHSRELVQKVKTTTHNVRDAKSRCPLLSTLLGKVDLSLKDDPVTVASSVNATHNRVWNKSKTTTPTTTRRTI